jgi:hypothetical protein
MQRFRLVTDDELEPTAELTLAELELLRVAVDKLRILVNNPLALVVRAAALLEGTAEPLLTI